LAKFKKWKLRKLPQIRNIHNAVEKALGNHGNHPKDLTWLRPTKDTNTVFFDFESYGYGTDAGKGKLNKVQDPFEIGMSVWSHVKEDWVHKSFTFTPQGLSEVLNTERAKQNPNRINQWMKERSAFTKKARPDTFDANKEDGGIKPLLDSIGNEDHEHYTPVPWDAIDKFLFDHGIKTGKSLHTVTHNGNNFDHGMLDALIEHSGRNSVFGQMFAATPMDRRHDTAATLHQIYGKQGRHILADPKGTSGTPSDGSLHKASSIDFNGLSYHANENENAYNGTKMDNMRYTMLQTYNENNTNRFMSMFHDNPEARASRKELFSSLGVSEVMSKITTSGVDLMSAFFDNVSHIGHGDTAVGALMVMDMLATEVELDHTDAKAVNQAHTNNPFHFRSERVTKPNPKNIYGNPVLDFLRPVEVGPNNAYDELVAQSLITDYADDDVGHMQDLKARLADRVTRAADKKVKDAKEAAKKEAIRAELGTGGTSPTNKDQLPFDMGGDASTAAIEAGKEALANVAAAARDAGNVPAKSAFDAAEKEKITVYDSDGNPHEATVAYKSDSSKRHMSVTVMENGRKWIQLEDAVTGLRGGESSVGLLYAEDPTTPAYRALMDEQNKAEKISEKINQGEDYSEAESDFINEWWQRESAASEAGSAADVSPIAQQADAPARAAGVENGNSGNVTPVFSESDAVAEKGEGVETESLGRNAMEIFRDNELRLNKTAFPKEIQSLIGNGDIDIFRHEGVSSKSSNADGRIVVIIPIGNTRVAFRESRYKAGRSTDTAQRFVPILGFANVTSKYNNDSNGDPLIETEGVDEYFSQLFGNNRNSGPLTSLHQMIEKVLLNPANLASMSEYLGDRETGKPTLDTTAANIKINTPASHRLNSSVGKPMSHEDIMTEPYQTYRNNANVAAEPFLEDGELNFEDSGALVSILLGDPLSGSQAFTGLNMLDPKTRKLKEGWFDVKTPEGKKHLQELATAFRDTGMAATPTSDTATTGEFDYDPANPSLVGMNLPELFDMYMRGDVPEGMHSKQLVNDPYGEISSLSDQFINFVLINHRVTNLGHKIPDILNVMNYDNPLQPNNTDHLISVGASRAASGDEDPTVAAAAAAQYANDSDVSDPATPDSVTENINQETYNRSVAYFALDSWAKSQSDPISASEYDEMIGELGDEHGYPFTSSHNIKGERVDYNNAETIDEMFPEREAGKTDEDILAFIAAAREEYEEDPTSMLRELEWIRDNHSERITQEAMQESLENDDRKSVVGQWIDTVKFASDNGADFAFVEEEKIKMEDRFMSSSHIEYIKQNPHQKVDMVENPPFEMPKGKKPATLGEKARQLAEGAWKQTGYYNVWRQLRNVKRDATGRKALEAARSGDVGAIRDLGITSQTQFMEHIGDLPVEGAEQRGLLGILWQGKKTFNDLAQQRAKEQAGNRKNNVTTSLQELDRLEYDRIQSRVPNRDISSADRKAAKILAEKSIRRQDTYNEEKAATAAEADRRRNDNQGAGSSDKTTPSGASFSGGASGGMKDPTTASAPPAGDPLDKKDVNIEKSMSKSLDKLKEYLASV